MKNKLSIIILIVLFSISNLYSKSNSEIKMKFLVWNEKTKTSEFHEESVNFYEIVPELKGLPPEVLKDSIIVQRIQNYLQTKYRTVKSGEKFQIKQEQVKKIFNDMGIKEALDKPELREMLTGNAESQKEAAQLLNDYFTIGPGRTKLAKALEEKIDVKDNKYNYEEIDDKKLTDFQSFIEREKKKLDATEDLSKSAQERSLAKRRILLKKIEMITGRTIEKIILTDGKEIEGVIYSSHGDFVILTPEGSETYPNDSIQSIIF